METSAPPNCTCASESSSSIPHWLNETFGYAGGVLLAFALIPQIYRTFKLRSARDMSYVWQAIYCSGLTLTLIYLVSKEALAAWVLDTVELALCVLYVCVKIYFEHFARRGKNVSFALIYSCFGGVHFEKRLQCAISELVDDVKEALGEMSFQPTHQVVHALGENEDEPASLRGIVHAFLYMNEFAIEIRYTETAQQLLVQLTANRELGDLVELSEKLDLRITGKLPGSFLLKHDSTL